MKMKRTITIFAAAAFALAVATIPAEVSAQWGGIFRGGDDYNSNNGYRGNARAAAVTLKNRSREFSQRLDRELDRSRYDGRWREDRVNSLAKELYRAADDLEDSWSNGRSSNRTDRHLRRVMMASDQLDRELSSMRLSWGLERDWSRVRQNVSVLVRSYSSYDRDMKRSGRDYDWNRDGRYDRIDWDGYYDRKKVDGRPF